MSATVLQVPTEARTHGLFASEAAENGLGAMMARAGGDAAPAEVPGDLTGRMVPHKERHVAGA